MHPTDPSKLAPRVRRPRRRRHGRRCRSRWRAAFGDRAREAAKRFAEAARPARAARRPRWSSAPEGYTYFVVYGHSQHAVDVSRPSTSPSSRTEPLTRDEIEHRVATRLGRKIVVVGACTGSDAHTVGIDAILNYKGYAGDKGLESYKALRGPQPRRAGRERRARRARAGARRRRHPGQPGDHAAQLPQGERARR